MQFAPSQEIRLSYRVKYAAGWLGTTPGTCCEHEFYVLTTDSPRFSPLARTVLSIYVEQARGVPVVRIQDGLHIEPPGVPVAGCGPIIGSAGSQVSCYGVGTARNNVRWWPAPVVALVPGEWHQVEVDLRLNDVGQANGVIRLSVNGTRMINAEDVLFRTAAHPTMLLSQLVIGPYLPQAAADQEFWVDSVQVWGTP